MCLVIPPFSGKEHTHTRLMDGYHDLLPRRIVPSCTLRSSFFFPRRGEGKSNLKKTQKWNHGHKFDEHQVSSLPIDLDDLDKGYLSPIYSSLVVCQTKVMVSSVQAESFLGGDQQQPQLTLTPFSHGCIFIYISIFFFSPMRWWSCFRSAPSVTL